MATIGVPTPVRGGKVIAEPVNLGEGWVAFDYEGAIGTPTKLTNDAAMQAIGSYAGGRMLFLGLGTGLGSALIVDGVVEPLELGHLPFRKRTFEDYVSERARRRRGHRKCRKDVFGNREAPEYAETLALRVTTLVFLGAFAADLLSKQWAIDHGRVVVFNSRPSELPLRVLMSVVAVGAALVLAAIATRRGLGRQWGLWVGVSLLIAGVLANGVSRVLWSQGVPDFIGVQGGWVWNVADFEIAIGMTGGILSVGVSALLVFTREELARRRVGSRA